MHFIAAGGCVMEYAKSMIVACRQSTNPIAGMGSNLGLIDDQVKFGSPDQGLPIIPSHVIGCIVLLDDPICLRMYMIYKDGFILRSDES